LILGRKLTGSLLNVTSRLFRNWFMPDNKLCGFDAVAPTQGWRW